MLSVKTFVNQPVTSNCYVLYDKAEGKECIIIDPGSRSDDGLFSYLEKEELEPRYIILTHEHFDHCWGVNALVERYHIPIICSQLCAEAIQYVKRNYSVFYDNKDAFTINSKTICVEELGNSLSFGECILTFYKTPGHSDASISILAGSNLFTGDTLIKDEKTVTKLPTGSVEKLQESMSLLASMKGKGLMVFPGHGEWFELDGYDLSKCWKGRLNEGFSYI